MKRKNIEIAGLKQEISELQQKASEDRGIQIDQLKNNLSLQQISQLHREEATSLQAIIIAKDKEL